MKTTWAEALASVRELNRTIARLEALLLAKKDFSFEDLFKGFGKP